MKTFLSEVKDTEKYLRREMPLADQLLFEANLLINARLKANTLLHRVLHRMVLLYHRKKLKANLQIFHNRLMSDPQRKLFREDLQRIFNQ